MAMRPVVSRATSARLLSPPFPLILSMIIAKALPPTIAFVAGIAVKTLLDLELATGTVRYLSWLPTRWLFRKDVYTIAGSWWQEWETDSTRFADDRTKRSKASIHQFFVYCVAEFEAGCRQYSAFGRITGDHLIGRWFDRRDPKGYYGTFQLEIVDRTQMRGVYLGHSKQDRAIKHGAWRWDTLTSTVL
jgi:hypothetical protein